MGIDQNGWQDAPEDETEALAQWEETQDDLAGLSHVQTIREPRARPHQWRGVRR